MSTCKDASGFPGGASAGDMRDAGSIPGSGRSLGRRHGNPFQYSCLENVMDRGAWWAAVHGVSKTTTEATKHNSTAAYYFNFLHHFLHFPSVDRMYNWKKAPINIQY